MSGTETTDIDRIQQQVLSRNSLAELIQRPSLDLYRGERQRMPVEDVIQRMRDQDILIRRNAEGVITIAFQYPDRERAQAVTREFVARFVETNVTVQRQRERVYKTLWSEDAPRGMVMEVLDPPSEARSTGVSGRPSFAVVGGLLGLILALTLRWPRAAGQLAVFAACGCLLAAAVSYLIPNRYVSTAVLRIAPPIDAKRWSEGGPREPFSDHVHRIAAQILSDQSLEELMQRPRLLKLYAEERSRKPIAEVAREMREHAVLVRELSPRAFQISFTYRDPFIAQAVVRELVTKAVEGYITEQRTRGLALGGNYKLMVDYKMGEVLEVLDPASLLQEPVFPNRIVIAAMGFAAGLLVGVAVLIRRGRGASPLAAAAAPAV